jgi:hypothetical protein
MFTLGTSSIRYIVKTIGDTTPVGIAIKDAMVAFVGTQYDRTGDTTDPDHPATFLAPRSVFFQVNAAGSTGTDRFKIAQPVTSIDVLIPAGNNPEVPDHWDTVGTLAPALFNTVIVPAGGFANALYAFPRGNEQDIPAAYKVAGLPFYSTDTQKLWVYDADEGRYIAIGSAAHVSAGLMFTYPEKLAAVKGLPPQTLLCDGSEKLIASYPILYALIENLFGTPSQPGYFVLPLMSNTVITTQ